MALSLVWRFLSKDKNRAVLGWVGGGVVIVIGALWAAFVYFMPPSNRAHRQRQASRRVAAASQSAAVPPGLRSPRRALVARRSRNEHRDDATPIFRGRVQHWPSTLASLTQAQQPSVRAESGSVAVGGNVRDSTINIGIPPKELEGLIRPYQELSETQKKLIAELEAKLDLNQRQVRAALDILGEKDIPPERLAAKLVEIAERFKALQATALAQPGDDAKVAALKAEAQKAIEAGDLAKADACWQTSSPSSGACLTGLR